MFGQCEKHGCSFVIQEVRHFPGKTIEICPECQKEYIGFILSGRMPRQQGDFTELLKKKTGVVGFEPTE